MRLGVEVKQAAAASSDPETASNESGMRSPCSQLSSMNFTTEVVSVRLLLT